MTNRGYPPGYSRGGVHPSPFPSPRDPNFVSLASPSTSFGLFFPLFSVIVFRPHFLIDCSSISDPKMDPKITQKPSKNDFLRSSKRHFLFGGANLLSKLIFAAMFDLANPHFEATLPRFERFLLIREDRFENAPRADFDLQKASKIHPKSIKNL